MNEWTSRRVLVTGAGGFLGSHLVERLLAEGADVRALLRYTSRGNWGNLDADVAAAVDIVFGDVRDVSVVARAVRGVEIVFHLAALVGIPYSYEAPDSYVATNVTGTLNVLDAVRAEGAVLVHTSTSEVYGTAQYVPIDERHPLVAQSPYSASKIAADMFAIAYHRAFGTHVTTLRPFNAFGPRQSARAVVPTIVTQLLKGEEVRIGSIHPERDLTFVTDTVDAFVRVATCREAEGKVVNAGSGVGVSVAQLIDRIAAIVGRNPRIVRDESRVRPPASEVDRLVSDSALAGRLLQWRPHVSLDEGLRLTVDWISQHVDAYRTGSYAR